MMNLAVGVVALMAAQVALASQEIVRHWAVEPMSDVMRLETTVPTDGDLGGTVRITMALGEYEPGSFVVQADRDLGKVKLEVGDFKQVEKVGGGGEEVRETGVVFPKEKLDLKLVKVWGQNRNAWYGYFGDNGRKLCPELLVNDEDLVRTDPKTLFNYAKLVEKDGRVHEQWIDPPYQFDQRTPGFGRLWTSVNSFWPMLENFKDAKTLQPITLKKGACRQFFLTARTEKDTSPGVYRGKVEIVGGGGQRTVLGSVPVSIKVLPFVLPRPRTYVRPDEDFFVANYNYIDFGLIMGINGGNRELMYRQYEAILRNQVEHGQDIHWIRSNVAATNRPDQVFEAMWTVDLMNRVGMRTDFLLGGCAPDLPWWGRKEPMTYEIAHRKAVENAALMKAAFGHNNCYMGYGDEPSVDWLKKQRCVFEAFQDEGFKFILAGWASIFGINPMAMDWQNVGGPPERHEIADKWNQLGLKSAWYANHHWGPENPAFNRRQYGFAPYFAGYSAVCNYAVHLGPWNDNSPKYRPMVNAYGTGDGVLDTLQWEGFREGIDDIRYATVLKELADRALKSDKGAVRRVGRRALAMCADFELDAGDLSAFRARLVDYILELMPLVGAPTLDKPLAKTVLQKPIPPEPKPGKPRDYWADYSSKHFAARDYKAAFAYFETRATNNRERVWRSLADGIGGARAGLFSAYLSGHPETMKAICYDVVTNSAKLKTNDVYEIRFAEGALAARGNAATLKREWTRLDDLYRVGTDDKFRLEAIERIGQIMVLAERPVDEIMTFWEWRESRLKPTPRKRYLVTWSDRRIVGPETWDELKLDESVFDRKWKGDFSFLTTDVSTGNRGVGAAGVKDGKTGAVSMSVVADDWGLHFRFTDRTDDAKAIGLGATGDGSYECYLAPGLEAPYACFIADVARDGGVSTWNTTYNTRGYRRLTEKDRKALKTANVAKDDRVETFVDVAWSTYYSRIPDGTDPWEFESLRWGKHNSAWNGTHYVHGRSTFGFLDFKFTPAQRAAIYRALLLQAKNEGTVGDVADYWQDAERGDPAFYAAVVKPAVDEIELLKKKIAVDMDDKTALDLGQTLLPRLKDFKYEIDAKRVRYYELDLTSDKQRRGL